MQYLPRLGPDRCRERENVVLGCDTVVVWEDRVKAKDLLRYGLQVRHDV